MSKKTQLSKNFTKEELEVSREALKKGLSNVIPESLLPNIQRLVTDILQPLRDNIAKPIIINSGYRSPLVNVLVGGVQDSYHTFALAADIKIANMTTNNIVKKIIDLDLPFDQVIEEFGVWVHVQVAKPGETPRKNILRARSVNGKTTYTKLKASDFRE